MEERRSKEKVLSLEIYTDGSLKKRGQLTFGGWGFIAVQDSQQIEARAGSEKDTTNQRMELTAIVEALKYASATRRTNEKIIIYSDSAYAINCYRQEWYHGWMANGWVNSKGEPVANQDLWYQIVPYFDNFWYDFRKVTGHAGNYWNECCDDLAQAQSEALKQEYRG
jgi:ribonuclease HI